MGTRNLPLTILHLMLAAFAAGICFARHGVFGLPPTLAFGAAGALLLLTAALAWRAPQRARLIVATCALLFCVLGVLRYNAATALPPTDISRHAGESATVTGAVAEEPQVTDSATGQYMRLKIAVREVGGAAASGGMYVHASRVDNSDSDGALGLENVRVGDEVRLSGEVREIHGYHNPGCRDLALLYRIHGVTATMSAGKAGITVRPREGVCAVARRIATMRRYVRGELRRSMNGGDAAALFAMMLGGYDGVDPALQDAFRATGIVHLLAVSGAHVALVALMAMWLLSLLGLPRMPRTVLALLIIGGYVLLARETASAVRAGLMGVVAGFAFTSTGSPRRIDIPRRALALVALLMLLWSPLQLFGVGFQLSVLATAGLVHIAPIVEGWLRARCRKWPAIVSEGLALAAGVYLATAPLTMWHFNFVSLIGVISGLLLMPLLEAVLVFALLGVLLALMVSSIGHVVLAFVGQLFGLAVLLVRALAALPFAAVTVITPSMWLLAAYYLAVLLFVMLTSAPPEYRPRRHRFAALGVAALLLVAMLGSFKAPRLAPQPLTLCFIDVGQGSATLAITPRGRAILFDCGGKRDKVASRQLGRTVLVPTLLTLGVNRLDLVCLTHAHEDHAGTLATIAKFIPIGRIVTAKEGIAAYRASLGLGTTDVLRLPMAAAVEGVRYDLDGCAVEVLYSPTGASPSTGNELSNVYRLRCGGFSALFTGDLDASGEAAMLAAGRDISATVLNVAHHGSRTGSTPAFVRAVNPRCAVIQCGHRNSYGHPHAQTLATLAAQNIELYRTDTGGAVTMTVGGDAPRTRSELP